MRNRALAAAIAILLLSLLALATRSAPAVAQSSVTWRVVGQVGGPTLSVAARRDPRTGRTYAYAGVGIRLVVLDATNPVSLTEVGATAPLPHFAEGVVVSGTWAYVAAGGAGLRVVDVSDPTRPVEVGAWDSPGYAEGVAISGTMAYLADGPFGLRAVDVSDARHPAPLGTAYDMHYAFDVAVSGRYAYVAAAGAGLLLVDISDPRQLREVATLDTPGYAQGVAVSGTLAYVADEWEGLQVVDVSDPLSPTLVSTCDTPGWSFGVVVSGTLAYVADAYAGLQLVDVSRPLSPTVLGGYPVDTGHAGAVVLVGGVAYVADRNWGVRAVRVGDPSRPAQAGFYEMFTDAHDVTVVGQHAYIAAGRNGLRVVDVSDPARARQVGIFPTQGYASFLDVQGEIAYVVGIPQYEGEGGGSYVVDVSQPSRPREIGHFPGLKGGWGIDVEDNVAYIAGDGYLWLLDVSAPNSPTFLGRTGLLCEGGGIDISGTLAYVADCWEGLKIVDVSDRYRPRILGGYNSGSSFSHDVAVTGTVAYLADHWGLRCIDVSDPRNPVGVAFIGTQEGASGVAVSGTMVCVAAAEQGVLLFDARNPHSPTLMANVNTPGHAIQVAMVGNRIYVADGSSGLLIYEPVTGNAGTPADIPRVQTQSLPAPLPESHPVLPRGAAPGVERASRPRESIAAVELDAPEPLLVYPRGAAAVTGTCTVTSTADSGPGTLRACLDSAASGCTITFDPRTFPATRPVTIAVLSPLPALTQGGLSIDASNAGVILDGGSAPPGTAGLIIASGGNVVRGLQIVHFPGDGIHIQGTATGNIIGGNRLVGSGPVGQGNLISGNDGGGVVILGSGAMSNTVSGNLIGTALSGTSLMGNGRAVGVGEGARHNCIGGRGEGEGNVIGGSRAESGGEVVVTGVGTDENVIVGNLIGTASDGASALRDTPPDTWIACVLILGGARDNVVGPGNVLNGGSSGVSVLERETQRNRIVGNRIGVDATGTRAIGNFSCGIELAMSTHDNVVGGTTADERNIISANKGDGLVVSDGACGNIVVGNYIGVDASGRRALGNGRYGIIIATGSARNRVGGADATERNIISGNKSTGVVIGGSGADANLVVGNYIGLDVDGRSALGNLDGVGIGSAANQVGGHSQAERNVISGNRAFGVHLLGSEARNNSVVGNYIGTDADGTMNLGNGGAGVGMEMGPNRNRIEGNVIAGSASYGVLATDWGCSYNVIVGNRIGTDATGTRAFPNGLGVYVGFMGASFNRIGGTNPGEGNLVSGNDAGVSVEGAGTAGNLVLGNWIGTDVSGARPLPNRWGGLLLGVGGRVLAGGTDAAGRNVISGNGRWVDWGWGLRIEGAHHYLAGNYVGIDAAGSGALGNGGAGVWLRWSEDSFIQGNVIAHNSDCGVMIESYCCNTLRRNSIYSHPQRGISLSGGNDLLPAPVITATNPAGVWGIACPGCTVEVFSDAEDEGQVYEGTAVSDASGRFAFTKSGGLTGPYVTTTATDSEGNTSEFSAPRLVWRSIWLPVIVRAGTDSPQGARTPGL